MKIHVYRRFDGFWRFYCPCCDKRARYANGEDALARARRHIRVFHS